MQPDRFPVRAVVVGLVLVLLLGMGAITLLAFQGTDVPQALETLTFGALTATTALLARTQPAVSGAVEVTNTPANPIPVEPASDTPPPAAAGAEPGV